MAKARAQPQTSQPISTTFAFSAHFSPAAYVIITSKYKCIYIQSYRRVIYIYRELWGDGKHKATTPAAGLKRFVSVPLEAVQISCPQQKHTHTHNNQIMGESAQHMDSLSLSPPPIPPKKARASISNPSHTSHIFIYSSNGIPHHQPQSAIV